MNKSIRLFTETGIGNQIQFIPALKVLKKAGYKLFSDSPLYLELLPNYISKPKKLNKNQKYDFGILLYHLGLPRAINAKRECNKLIGFPYSFKVSGHRPIPFLSTLFLDNKICFNENQSEIENNIKLLQYFGLKNPEIDYSVDIVRKPEKNVIGMSIGSGAHPEKRWKYFIDLVNNLPHKHFRLFGMETELNKDLVEHSLYENVEIVETETLMGVSLEIAKCEIFVSNDNGLMHLADLLHVPTIAIFGMTNVIRNGPWNKPHKVVSLNMWCSPCYHNGRIKCNNKEHYACMNIPIDLVMDAINNLEKSL